jgi:hypothetical protein
LDFEIGVSYNFYDLIPAAGIADASNGFYENLPKLLLCLFFI